MYTEEQKIKSGFIKIAFLMAILISIIGISLVVMQGNATGEAIDLSVIYIGVAIIAVVFILVYAALFRNSLTISLDDYRITFTYFPFLRKPLTIEYNNVVSWQQRKLRSIFDYGGYGYRKDLIQKKTGFIMGGKNIFELKLSNDRRIGFTAANSVPMFSELTKQLPNKQIK